MLIFGDTPRPHTLPESLTMWVLDALVWLFSPLIVVWLHMEHRAALGKWRQEQQSEGYLERCWEMGIDAEEQGKK